MKDYILRVSAGEGSIIAFIATTKELVQKAHEIHNTSALASATLGRTLTATAMISQTLKNEHDLVTLSIKGSGPTGGVVVTADQKANVKGYVFNPGVELPLNNLGKLDVANGFGAGMLTMIKDIGLKQPYVGQTHLVSGEIAEDIAYYYTASEQVPSAVALGVLVDTDLSIKQSGGFIVQLLPGAKEEYIEKLEANLSSMASVTTMLEEGKTPEDILEILLNNIDYKIYDKLEPNFSCNCDKTRVEKALISIGKDELTKILEEDGKTSLNCHFCNTSYDFSGEEIQNIIDNL
ncbi:MAG: Hsp33 family molecular chaperone HslO [Clostridia bacterium]|jgi:molecular chaperone Hsp33|nr:Hsp33 family molecular chaperone HslO [Clostridia bacterium]